MHPDELTIFSGAAIGIARALEINGIGVNNLNVIASIWTISELTATFIAVGIPTSLPVWRAVYFKFAGNRAKETPYGSAPLALFTIGGRKMTVPAGTPGDSGGSSGSTPGTGTLENKASRTDNPLLSFDIRTQAWNQVDLREDEGGEAHV